MRIYLISSLVKPGDQALISISTILKFSALTYNTTLVSTFLLFSYRVFTESWQFKDDLKVVFDLDLRHSFVDLIFRVKFFNYKKTIVVKISMRGLHCLSIQDYYMYVCDYCLKNLTCVIGNGCRKLFQIEDDFIDVFYLFRRTPWRWKKGKFPDFGTFQ